MKPYVIAGLLAFSTAVPAGLSASPAAPAEVRWQLLQRGVEYATLAVTVERVPGDCGDGRLHVVRVDPGRAKLVAVTSKLLDTPRRTAAEWAKDHDLVVAINMGMFRGDDGVSHVGHARVGGKPHSPGWNDYQSALAFGPTSDALAPAIVVDLDEPGQKERTRGYGSVIQNLRLIKAPGRNRWSRQKKRWSEAAIGMDRSGRVLLMFTATPLPMWKLNERLLALPLDVVQAMHAEGGPEASLSIHGGGIDLDLAGRFETGFVDTCRIEAHQWNIPNVIGVVRKAAPAE